jgi:hypothetical protein
MNGCQICGGYGMRHDPVAHGWGPDENADNSCHDTCVRMVCEWCPGNDLADMVNEAIREANR